jgi:hypothetical protein
MEALRNYAQHAGDPVYGAIYDATWVEAGQKLRFSTDPYLSSTDLGIKGNFKTAVLKELEFKGKQISLKAMLRDYVEGLCEVHAEIRRHIEKKYNESKTVIKWRIL